MVLATTLLLCNLLLVQPPSGSQVATFQRDKPINCEDLLAMLDHAIIEWQKLEDTHLIVITRLGKGERDPKLSRARLDYVEDYLKKKKVDYVLATGERVAGLGRFEVYVGGRLHLSVAVKRGSNRLCWGTTGA
jgi:hypothetical protein